MIYWNGNILSWTFIWVSSYSHDIITPQWLISCLELRWWGEYRLKGSKTDRCNYLTLNHYAMQSSYGIYQCTYIDVIVSSPEVEPSPHRRLQSVDILLSIIWRFLDSLPASGGNHPHLSPFGGSLRKLLSYDTLNFVTYLLARNKWFPQV